MRPGSDYTEHFMREVQNCPSRRLPQDAFYRQFHETDFHLQDDRALFDWGCRQAYIALGNMMSAAAMIGIDSCPIEASTRLARKSAGGSGCWTWKNTLAVMVAFGYRVNPQPAKTRRRWNRWCSGFDA